MKLVRKLLDLGFIVGLGLAAAALLLAARSWSAPAIERYRETRLKFSVLAAAGVSAPAEGLASAFDEHVREQWAGGLVIFRVDDSLLVYEFTGRGLWGMIEGVITFDTAVTRIGSVRILAQEETPGLGSRITEEEYLATYRDKDVTSPLGMALRHASEGPNEVDAISGATLSSQALLDAVNQAAARVRAALRGGA